MLILTVRWADDQDRVLYRTEISCANPQPFTFNVPQYAKTVRVEAKQQEHHEHPCMREDEHYRYVCDGCGACNCIDCREDGHQPCRGCKRVTGMMCQRRKTGEEWKDYTLYE